MSSAVRLSAFEVTTNVPSRRSCRPWPGRSPGGVAQGEMLTVTVAPAGCASPAAQPFCLSTPLRSQQGPARGVPSDASLPRGGSTRSGAAARLQVVLGRHAGGANEDAAGQLPAAEVSLDLFDRPCVNRVAGRSATGRADHRASWPTHHDLRHIGSLVLARLPLPQRFVAPALRVLALRDSHLPASSASSSPRRSVVVSWRIIHVHVRRVGGGSGRPS